MYTKRSGIALLSIIIILSAGFVWHTKIQSLTGNSSEIIDTNDIDKDNLLKVFEYDKNGYYFSFTYPIGWKVSDTSIKNDINDIGIFIQDIGNKIDTLSFHRTSAPYLGLKTDAIKQIKLPNATAYLGQPSTGKGTRNFSILIESPTLTLIGTTSYPEENITKGSDGHVISILEEFVKNFSFR